MTKVIEVKNLVKKFARHPDKSRAYGIRDLFRDIIGRKREIQLRKDEFYAINNISFSIAKGECVGLVGRNGSGKSTLLRVIAGLQRADFGKVTVKGSLQALIALGAGFDPKLDGIENIKNVAAIAGIGPKQSALLIDKIIEFSELEDVIDSPVGNYSSGMYARLGFSVAVFLKPEILLIDEILGVGDYAFQNKCFLKIHEIRNSGTTIVLVTHSHSKIIQMCNRTIWLDKGNVVTEGESREVVDKYIASMEQESVLRQQKVSIDETEKSNAKWQGVKEGPYGPMHIRDDFVSEVKVEVSGEYPLGVRTHSPCKISYSFRLVSRVSDLNVSVNILTQDGVLLTTISTLNGNLLKNIHSGVVTGEIHVHDLVLNPGSYVIVMPIHDGQAYLYRDVVAEFSVQSGDRLTWGKVDFNYDFRIVPLS